METRVPAVHGEQMLRISKLLDQIVCIILLQLLRDIFEAVLIDVESWDAAEGTRR